MIEDLPDDIVTEDDLDDIEPVGDEAQLYEHFRVVVDRGQEMMRVDKYLFDRLTNASRNRIQKSAEAGFVMANNKPVKSSYKVKPMDVITIMMIVRVMKTKSFPKIFHLISSTRINTSW